MSKREKIFLTIIVILTIALIIMIALYFNMRKSAQENLNHFLDKSEEVSELNHEISNLKEAINNIITN